MSSETSLDSFDKANKDLDDLLSDLDKIETVEESEKPAQEEEKPVQPKSKATPRKKKTQETGQGVQEPKPKISTEKVNEFEKRITDLKEAFEQLSSNLESEIEKRVNERLEAEMQSNNYIRISDLAKILAPSKELDDLADTSVAQIVKMLDTLDFNKFLEWSVRNFDKLADYQTAIKRMVTKKYLKSLDIDDALKMRVMGVVGEKEGSAETKNVSLHFTKIMQYMRDEIPELYFEFAKFIKDYNSYLQKKVENIGN